MASTENQFAIEARNARTDHSSSQTMWGNASGSRSSTVSRERR